MIDFSQTPIAELAAQIAEHLASHHIDVVLVGGLAVEIYSENLYLTCDIDMVNTNYQPAERLNVAMAELGFIKRGRVYVNSTTPIVAEFPSAPLSIGDELITQTTFCEVAGKRIPILTVADVIKDRLAAYVHWKDYPSLIQAVTLMIKRQQPIEAFKAFCEREGDAGSVVLLEALHRQAVAHKIQTMADMEPMLSRILLEQL